MLNGASPWSAGGEWKRPAAVMVGMKRDANLAKTLLTLRLLRCVSHQLHGG